MLIWVLLIIGLNYQEVWHIEALRALNFLYSPSKLTTLKLLTTCNDHPDSSNIVLEVYFYFQYSCVSDKH